MAEPRELDAATRARLLKLLGMTGSAHEGEQLNALRMVLKVMAEKKLTWNDVLASERQAPKPDPMAAAREAWGFDRPTAKSRPPGSAFRESERQRQRDDVFRTARDNLDPEKIAVRIARERLDVILSRRKLTPQKRAHFDAILKQHQQSGYIGMAHRTQIDRAFFTEGWDEPLGGAKPENNADRKARAWADLKAAMGEAMTGAGVEFILPDDLMEMFRATFDAELDKGGTYTAKCGLCGKQPPTTKLGSTGVCQHCWDTFATPDEKRAAR
jgi:hypothetical protein